MLSRQYQIVSAEYLCSNETLSTDSTFKKTAPHTTLHFSVQVNFKSGKSVKHCFPLLLLIKMH